ncbi:MAG: methionyl-tRNA formyltransferase [Deltaproteobacteria bacterium]|nr:methionyl-tRNA formyltransferase [Deltaproteobacteria bacterium]
MRIVFMGTPAIAATVLRALVLAGRAPVLVVSQPDRPRGRGLGLVPTPVHAVADELGLPVLQPEKIDDAAFDRLREARPDLIVVVAYGKILRKRVLDLPPHGCVNAHASILPQYRGAAPINWAIIRGESETGVSIMKLDEGMDTGPVGLVRRIPIAPDDTAATLTDKLADLAAAAMVEAIDRIETGEMTWTAQGHDRADYAPMLEKDDGLIDWTRPCFEIDRLIRGVTPWPGAQTTLGSKRLKILAATPEPGVDGEPHVILEAGRDGIVVACGEGALRIARLQLEGKKAMDARDFVVGARLVPGDRIGR